ncbi:hypothetical protein K2X33_13680 [bacterium]|nr:hypothetical protein [bacterium]
MIRISIDDSLAESANWEKAESVEDVVKAVTLGLPPDRIVTSVSVDGQMLTRQQTCPALKERLQSIRELQIRTADARAWAIHGLDRAVADINRLQQSLLLAAEYFRDERVQEGNRIFLRCIEGLERFLDTIVLTRLAMKLDFNRMCVDGIPFSRLEKDLSLILRSIVTAQEQQDYETLADKVEYELLTCFHSWSRGLQQLKLSAHSNA